MDLAHFWNNTSGAYQINQSLRFDSGAYLSRTPGSAGNRKTYSISLWAKKTTLDTYLDIFVGRPSGTQQAGVRFVNQSLQFYNQDGASFNIETTLSALSRDPSAWYHIFIAVDTTNATAANRARAWLNGVELATSAKTNPTQNLDTYINTTDVHYIGVNTVSSNPFSGYLAEFNFIDGTALTPSSFGETDTITGAWIPKKYSGSYGTNGFYLKFDPSATNGIGHDHSGNGNHFTPSGFTTSGTGTDVMSDTPTNNWCTLNPIGSTTTGGLSEGNLNYLNGTTAAWRSAVSSFAVSSGKWYFEAKFTNFPASSAAFVGIGPDTVQWVNNLSHFGQGSASGSYGYYSSNGNIYFNGSGSSYGATYSTNDVIGCALDLDAGTLRFYKNGVDQGQAASGLTGTWNVGVSSLDTPAIVNFGQRAFEQTVPTGYSALNTSNLPAPTVKDGSKNFNTVLWTGDGASSQTVSGVGFQPDWVWFKSRSLAQPPTVFDAVRTGDKKLRTSSTDAENSGQGFSFNSDGWGRSIYDAESNSNGDTYVAWNWKANGSGSSNTDGSITSTVSANPSAGFSIVSYTGTGANATVGHGLGVAPRMVITKSRDGGSWGVYHASVGANYILYLDLTDAAFSNVYAWNNTAPTSTVFTVSQSDACNTLNEDYIAYCFAEVEGYSKFGTYERNGSSDGPYVHLGFTPALILIKEYAAGTEGWALYDNKRLGYNSNDYPLFPNTAQTESYISSTYANEIDFLSNGFKIRTSDSRYNSSLSSYRYLYAAWAVNPFGGSGVSPATAR